MGKIDGFEILRHDSLRNLAELNIPEDCLITRQATFSIDGLTAELTGLGFFEYSATPMPS